MRAGYLVVLPRYGVRPQITRLVKLNEIMIVPISCRIRTIYSCYISETGEKQIITLNQNMTQHQTRDQERSIAVNKQASSVTAPHGTSVYMQISLLWMICYTFKLTHQPEHV